MIEIRPLALCQMSGPPSWDGILLGVAFYFPGGLWTAFGVHLGWNVTLAALDDREEQAAHDVAGVIARR